MVNLPVYWRRINNRYNLVGTQCKTCNTHFFPPRSLCPSCRRKGDVVSCDFSGKGTVVSWTEVHAAPEGHGGNVPYLLALVKLEEGPTVMAQLVEIHQPSIGQDVEVAFRKISEHGKDGIICYGYKFRPAKNQKKA